MTCGIYKITNTVTGEFYIGQSPNIESRWDTHKSAWQKDLCKITGRYLLESVKQYGIESFSFQVIEICDSLELRSKEAEWCRRLRPSLNGHFRSKKNTRVRRHSAVPLLKNTQASTGCTKRSVIKWQLREVMERHRITNKELADKMGRHESAISRLRSAKTLPAIGGNEIEALAKILTELLHARGYDISVTSKDLVGFADD